MCVGGSSKISVPGGISMLALMSSRMPPRPEMNVSRVLEATLDVLEAADGVEVVPLVVVERRFLAQPPEHRVRVGVDVDVVRVVVDPAVDHSRSRFVRIHTSWTLRPPSTGMIAPVTNDARSETRNAATSATSCGCPSALERRSFGSARVLLERRAHDLGLDEPGQTQFTRMPLPAVLERRRLRERDHARLGRAVHARRDRRR